MTDDFDHLARITPVDRSQSANILGLASLLVSAVALVAVQAGWVLLMFTGLLLLNVNGYLALLVLLTSLAWLALQFSLVFLYPEWPLNRVLSLRLLRSVENRDHPLVTPRGDHDRVVELVPRSRWRRLALETATDLMVIRIDDRGLWMTGDRCEYALPSHSILGAELASIKPSGWFTETHMVIVFVRTADGPIELPIAYRDHSFGSLRSSRRRCEAIELTSKINRIARGSFFQPPTVPEPDDTLQAAAWSENPFQTPTLL